MACKERRRLSRIVLVFVCIYITLLKQPIPDGHVHPWVLGPEERKVEDTTTAGHWNSSFWGTNETNGLNDPNWVWVILGSYKE